MTAPAFSDKGIAGSDGPIARHLNRPLSQQISGRAWQQPITPNQWSLAAFGLVCAGSVAFAAGAPRFAALLVHAGSVVDGVDGEVARLQGTAGAEGALFDLTLDRIGDVSLLAGLAMAAGSRKRDWLLALVAANGILTASVIKERVSAERLSPSSLQRAEASAGGVRLLLPWANRDGRLFAVTALGLLKRPRLALLWLAVTSTWRLLERLTTARTLLRDAEE